MKITKELEKRIDEAIEQHERNKRENKVVLYTHEEVMKSILGDDYIPELHSLSYNRSKKAN